MPINGVEAATVIDVLFDQLEFLIGHHGMNMPMYADCPDCQRLKRVVECLMELFT